MATRQADMGDVNRVERVPIRSAFDETKGSLMTTEFWAMAGVIAAILIATQQLDHMTGQEGWTLVAAVAIGYMLSRGLSKSGSSHRDGDY